MGHLDEYFAGLDGFDWDAGNSDKNWHRHAVRQGEAEQSLLNRPVLVLADIEHSSEESRFIALGHTDANRRLVVVFTITGTRIRVVSARPMSRVERRIYDQAQEDLEENP